jgi:hypothetical protein
MLELSHHEAFFSTISARNLVPISNLPAPSDRQQTMERLPEISLQSIISVYNIEKHQLLLSNLIYVQHP